MRVLITGGHFSPARAVLKKLIEKNHIVAIAGRKHVFEGDNVESLEYLVARKDNIPFYEIRTGRIQRKFTKFTIPSILKIPMGTFDAFTAILKFKPDVVLTFGGYISFPVSCSAFLLRVPIVLHDQTQKAGLAGKIIGPIAHRVCISFENSRKYFRNDKVVFTGNPVRREIYKVKKTFQIEKKLPIVYFTGGSSGSHFINCCVGAVLEKILERYAVIHQVGDSKFFNDFERFEKRREQLPELLKKRYILKKFIYPEEIGSVLNSATLVVARAGINTVMEMLALGKMVFLIPLSHGQTNEQLENAELIKEIGIGEYVEEKDVSPDNFYEKIQEMIENRESYESQKKKAQTLILKDADTKIVKALEEVYGEKTN